MAIILGLIILCISVFGSYAANGGVTGIFLQPIILVLISGASLAAFLIANEGNLIRRTMLALPELLKWQVGGQVANRELQAMLKQVLTDTQTHGPAVARQELAKMPLSAQHPALLAFLNEAMRLQTLPGMQAEEFARILEQDLAGRATADAAVTEVFCRVARAFLAFGGFASVLMLVYTLERVDPQDPEFGLHLALALAGFVLGAMQSWGILYPLAARHAGRQAALLVQCRCVALSLGAHMRHQNLAMALELGVRALPPEDR